MRTRVPRVVVTFHTTAESMKTERVCQTSGIEGRLISAPRALSADCGIAWSGPVETRQALERALADAGVEIAGFCELVL